MKDQTAAGSQKRTPAGAVTERPGTSELEIQRTFSTEGVHPFDQITWETRSASIRGSNGEVIFEQKDAEVPADWSQLATNVVVSKYFYGDASKAERERSVKQLIHRVTRTLADWARDDGLMDAAAAEVFYEELTWLCVNQYASFNSPVWFNVGLFHEYGIEGGTGSVHWDQAVGHPVRTERGYEYPQASACFIQSVADNMESIMDLAKSEAMLFKFGSGTGTDLSSLRSSREKLAGGGTPSGPLSFMRVYDQVAAVVKSGGKTRRAAKMQSLRCDHPDIREFIEAKTREEKKAWALIEEGYDGDYNGEAYGSVMFQNANLSVRVTDEFMQAAVTDGAWQTFEVTTGNPSASYRASELLDLIAEGTRICGDPGVQYHSTINKWHTCPNSGTINGSNPCSEYMFIDDSACNLASLNLIKFRRDDGSFDVERFRTAVRLFIIAQEILVDHASYPTAPICTNSHRFRPLGLGYANLGSLLMSLGLPYAAGEGRALAGAITAVMTGAAYEASAELAAALGPFEAFADNRDPMLNVMAMHRAAVDAIAADLCPAPLLSAAADAWDRAIAAGREHGYRNAQVSVLAPTGTIGFMMDCDTTGVEPDIALVKYKLLAGGGMFKIVNRTVPQALRKLGYEAGQTAEIVEYIEHNDTIEGAPGLREEHLAVFDCAFKPAKGHRFIHHMDHIRMMAAVQPFLSGAISKTVNMPKESTAADIREAYTEGWRLGLKAVAIYRDGSKRSQPVNTSHKKKPAAVAADAAAAAALAEAMRRPHRNRLPDTRQSITHKFDIAGHEGYITVGLFEDGSPGEVFITMAKEGSTVGGMMDAFATAISLCLQYGVPLDGLVKKFSHQRFEPSGMTANRDIPFAKSIVDYIFRWLGLRFLADYRKANLPQRPGKAGDDGADSSSAAPEVVTEDATSDPSRAGEAGDKDVQRPVGALSEPSSPAGPARKAMAAGTRATGGRLSRSQSVRMRVDQQFSHFQEDAPPCDNCGSITVRNGNCYKCYNCGNSLGCS
ncbi:MAG: vitamin B12-dependent ribonucleotide reductase [Planctomycetes bacterium]|nr:vitamin B12-dependent ribonucleotide reductase [Planctomycetota bacterium]